MPSQSCGSPELSDLAPKITVAIPTMNGERHLPETLRSVLAQESVAYDLIVSDDRSDDGTLDVARAILGDRGRIVVNSERLGLAGNWNRCVALSGTALVAIVHQDDLLRPGHLALHAGAFGGNSKVGIVASASSVIDAEGVEIPQTIVGRGGLGPVDRTFVAREVLPFMAIGNPLRCSAVSIRAEAHSQAHGFDPALRYVIDWDFWLRLAASWSLAWIADTTVDVRWHASSETHRFKTGTADLEETLSVFTRLLRDLTSDEISKKTVERAATKSMGRAYLNRAYELLKGANGTAARACLKQSIRLDPMILTTIVADPRLAAQMAVVWGSPTLSARWFRRAKPVP